MAELLKNLYNKAYIELLSSKLQKNYSDFHQEQFIQDVFDDSWTHLELKERMRHITHTLYEHLPKIYPDAIAILKNTFSNINFAYGLENMIFQDYVEIYGIDDLKISLMALEHFTINSSSEFAIRRFILKYPIEVMQQMKLWAHSENEHIRRLASEGCRPRLPWAIALNPFKNNPHEVIQILELLKDDESLYVRKSVANNLNDISKDNPNITRDIATRWLEENSSRYSMIKHASRTLLKQSDKKTLELFGFNSPKNIKLSRFTCNTSVKMDKELEFSFDLHTDKELGKLRIEFAIDFLRKNQKHNKKVFKISEGDYSEVQKNIVKQYSFKPISTRVYYKGLHHLSIIINGVVFKKHSFELT